MYYNLVDAFIVF